jgi:single-strand DNA-binding protein
MMNRVTLIGRLTADPELRYTLNGKAVAHFTLAVDRRYKNAQGERETDFIRIVAWEKRAEFAANYLTKGRLTGVDGWLQIRSYETPQGERRSIAEVVVDSIQGLDRPREDAPTPEASPVAATPPMVEESTTAYDFDDTDPFVDPPAEPAPSKTATVATVSRGNPTNGKATVSQRRGRG